MSNEAYASAPDNLTVRELKVDGKILVTTFCCPKSVPKHALKDLYKSRWNVELDLRHIKTTLGMETLSCKTPEMAFKELWIYMLAYKPHSIIDGTISVLDRMPTSDVEFQAYRSVVGKFYQSTAADP